MQIGREARQTLVIGQDRARRVAEHVAVIEAEKAEQDGNVLADRGGAEMLVDGMAAIEEAPEILLADGDHQRQADRGPDRVAAADPIPETEDAGLVDAEGGDLVERRRDGSEVVADGDLAELVGDEGAGGRGIGHRLDRREGLRGDDKERGFRIDELQRVGDVGAVDVGDKVKARAVMEGRESQRRHDRAKVGAADADVDDIGDLLAGGAFQRARADAVGKGAHGVEHAVDVGHHVLAVDEDRAVAAVAQRRVQHGTLLGDVDDVAAEHGVPLLLDLGRLG
ncbi:hypothetical protein D9M68_389340 [compost metagenome]